MNILELINIRKFSELITGNPTKIRTLSMRKHKQAMQDLKYLLEYWHHKHFESENIRKENK